MRKQSKIRMLKQFAANRLNCLNIYGIQKKRHTCSETTDRPESAIRINLMKQGGRARATINK